MIRFIFSISLLTVLFSSCGSSVIDGYSDRISYNVGDTLKLFLNSDSKKMNYSIDITTINGKFIDEISVNCHPQVINDDRAYENGFGYELTTEYIIPSLESGVYLFDGKIPFVVKPKEKKRILVVYSSNTENAYAFSGGKSLYGYNSTNQVAATTVSFQRPIDVSFHSTEFLKWMEEQEEYDVGYICDQDLDHYESFSAADLLIVPGHSEYWTRKARLNFDQFIDSGKNALILSGNTMYWQVRYSEDGNQMICYKNLENDPEPNNQLKTFIWTDSVLQYPVLNSIGLDFEHGGFGLRDDKGWDGYKITNSNHALFKGLNLKNGDVLSIPSDEYDGAILKFSKDSTSVELIDEVGFFNYELLGYDLGSRSSITNGAWVIMQKSETSGMIINTGTTDWCSPQGIGGDDADLIQVITKRMIDRLLK